MGAASGRPSPNGAGGRLGNSIYAPLVLKALASAGIKSIGHPLVLEALAIHLFLKPPATTCLKSLPVVSHRGKPNVCTSMDK